jgi:hypothetical protein
LMAAVVGEAAASTEQYKKLPVEVERTTLL